MGALQKTSSYASFSKFLPPSTRKSWLQILSTLLITFSIVGGIAWLENEQKNDKKCEYKLDIPTIICLISDSKLLGQVQNIGVLSAAILFFWDTFDRKKQLERQAWQLIDGAQGSETSGARRQAIEELYKEGADITGLDADGADLRGINLSGANLERASFKNAILEEANFEGANLYRANFTGANLKSANFKGANLWGADLTGVDLYEAHLEGTDLGNATLNKANLCNLKFGKSKNKPTNLTGARLRRANIQKVNLEEVIIRGAYLGGAVTGKILPNCEDKLLDIEIIRKAKDNSYKQAYYDENFQKSYPDEKLEFLDEEYEKEKQSRKNRDEKIQQIRNRIFTSLQDKDNSSALLVLVDALIEILSESGQESNTTFQ
ncbi:pentapeptide repeat-containing protein [Scytonema tolypothrichoides VB-61278]|nr:pentapeptide repeat-containing protein [Scytonema tolypothrichoides VB-61278]